MATAVINTMNYETIVHRFSTMLRNTLCMVPCCIAIMSSTSSADRRHSGSNEAGFFTRDLIVFIEGLDLDDTQQIIVEALFDDYEHGFDEGMAGGTSDRAGRRRSRNSRTTRRSMRRS